MTRLADMVTFDRTSGPSVIMCASWSLFNLGSLLDLLQIIHLSSFSS
jgi:hypothetical protein